MSFVNLLFPDTLAFGARGGRRYSTDVVENRGGAVKKNTNWPDPLGKWEVGQVNRTEKQTLQLQAFFHRMQGRSHSFLFKDHKDCMMINAATERLTSTTFQLRMRYATTDGSTYLPVYHPDRNALEISLGSTPTTAYTVSITTGIVTLSSAVDTSVTVRASGLYYIEVRLNTDHFDPEEVDVDIYSWPSVQLVEERQAA